MPADVLCELVARESWRRRWLSAGRDLDDTGCSEAGSCGPCFGGLACLFDEHSGRYKAAMKILTWILVSEVLEEATLGERVPGAAVSTSLAHRILQSFRARHAGATSTATYFVAQGFGARAAVDQALARLARSGNLQRVDRGVYQLPRQHPRLGILPARAADVVDAVRHSLGTATVKVQPDGPVSANQLGLSTQVPMQPTWLTSGRGRTTRIGRQTIRFVHDASLPAHMLGTTAGQVIVALRWLGPDGASPQDLQRLARQLSDADKRRLARAGPLQPVWMRVAVGRLADGL